MNGTADFRSRTFKEIICKQCSYLDDVSFSLQKGEVVVIVGPSGCGKSTLPAMYQRLEEIDTGVLKLNGVKLMRKKKEYKQSQREDRNGFPEL